MPSITVQELPPHKLKGAYDAGKASLTPRERLRMDEDGFPEINGRHGHELTERIRRAPSEKWVTWSGNVIYARLTGSGQRRGSDPAREQQLKEQLHNGKAIRYGTCPLRDPLSLKWIPASMRQEKPCKPGTHGEGKCCPHIEKVIEVRRAMHGKLEAKRAEKYKNKLHETQEQNMALTERLLSELDGRGKPTVLGD